MVWLHNLFENLWTGILSGLSLVDGELGTFVQTFSPITEDIEEQKRIRLMLDGIQLGLTLLLAPAFHTALARNAWAMGRYFNSS